MKETSIETLNNLFELQKKAFAKEMYPSAAPRIERLKALEKMMIDLRERAVETLQQDFAVHPPFLTDLLETGCVISRCRYLQEHVEEWMQPQDRPLDSAVHGSTKAYVMTQPFGVVGNISPWNFPIECALIMVADMLAAGNRVIVKVSEFAPATSQLLQESVGDYFSPDVLAIVVGDANLSKHFASQPWNHLCYIGGGAVGKLIMEAAAKNLTPITLELGGKNPALFAEDGIEDQLIQDFVSSRFVKSGQVCTSPDYVLIPRSQVKQFTDIATQFMQRTFPTYIGHSDVTGIINQRHYNRILEWLEEAKGRGVEIIPLNDEKPDPVNRQIPMYLLIDPPEDLNVMQEEIFGPLIPVVPYDSFDQAIDYINSRPRPLGAYIATKDSKLAKQFTQSTISGGCAINAWGLQGAEPSIPFGGNGGSGIGCHSGREGFLNFSHKKSVFDCGDDNKIVESIRLPYGDFSDAFVDALFSGGA